MEFKNKKTKKKLASWNQSLGGKQNQFSGIYSAIIRPHDLKSVLYLFLFYFKFILCEDPSQLCNLQSYSPFVFPNFQLYWCVLVI